MPGGSSADIYNYPDLTHVCFLGISSGSDDNKVYGPITSKQLQIVTEGYFGFDTIYIRSDNISQTILLEPQSEGPHIVNIPEQFLKENPIYLENISEVSVQNQIPLTSKIEITCSTSGSQIYYTTDNSNPDQSSSLYTETFEVEDGTIIKAIAYKEGYIESNIKEYTI